MNNDNLSFARLITEDIRLVLLRALQEDSGYSLNESVLHTVLELFGHKVGRDRVRTELAWLAEQGLVVIERVASVDVATITRRGADAAVGRIAVPGVKRPGPRG